MRISQFSTIRKRNNLRGTDRARVSGSQRGIVRKAAGRMLKKRKKRNDIVTTQPAGTPVKYNL